jgi:hypothetical protein
MLFPTSDLLHLQNIQQMAKMSQTRKGAPPQVVDHGGDLEWSTIAYTTDKAVDTCGCHKYGAHETRDYLMVFSENRTV